MACSLLLPRCRDSGPKAPCSCVNFFPSKGRRDFDEVDLFVWTKKVRHGPFLSTCRCRPHHVSLGEITAAFNGACRGKETSLVKPLDSQNRHEGIHEGIRADPLLPGALPSVIKCPRDFGERPLWINQNDVKQNVMLFEESCADRVVRVRTTLSAQLSCRRFQPLLCPRSWNNKSCMAWPVFTRDEKLDWLEECYSE